MTAWPALQQILLDGWILRFADGYTKRANSVNPLYPSFLPPEEKIPICERHYRERGLPVIFRLTDSAPASLDQELEARDYASLDPTLVMIRNLSRNGIPAPDRRVEALNLEEWMAAFEGLHSSPPHGHETHRRIVASISATRRLVMTVVGDAPASCGMAVLEGGAVGLFDLLTANAHRNQGHASALVADLLGWAHTDGARLAYLQVTEENTTARRFYENLGFATAYAYRYRRAD